MPKGLPSNLGQKLPSGLGYLPQGATLSPFMVQAMKRLDPNWKPTIAKDEADDDEKKRRMTLLQMAGSV